MSRADKRPVCTCPVYNFPHHRDNFCRIEEDGTDRDDVREQDNADRARDCQAEANAGRMS
jgi:hypothetical protein